MILDKNEATKENLQKEIDEIAKKLGLKSIEEAYGFPKFFQIETTQVCNAKCPFCTSATWENDKVVMSDELFLKIATEIAKHKEYVGFVDLQRVNEPLTDKKIVQKVALLKELGIKKVMFSTNASLLTEQKSIELLKAGLDEILFSIDSIHKEEYEALRIGLKFERVMENIKRFFAIRDEIRPEMTIRVRGVSFYDTAKKEELEKVLEWERYWDAYKKPQDRVYMKRAHNWGNQKAWSGHSFLYHDIYHPCILPWSTMHIAADGGVSICPNDFDTTKLKIGDLSSDTIESVWSGEAIKKLRELHASGARNEIPLCVKCILFDAHYSLEDDKKFSESNPIISRVE